MYIKIVRPVLTLQPDFNAALLEYLVLPKKNSVFAVGCVDQLGRERYLVYRSNPTVDIDFVSAGFAQNFMCCAVTCRLIQH